MQYDNDKRGDGKYKDHSEMVDLKDKGPLYGEMLVLMAVALGKIRTMRPT